MDKKTGTIIFDNPSYAGFLEEEKKRVQKASKIQVSGTHYKHFTIQPAEFCYKNQIPYLEATAIKYLCRWRLKNGKEDLLKARHFIDLLLEFHDEEVEQYKNKGDPNEPPF